MARKSSTSQYAPHRLRVKRAGYHKRGFSERKNTTGGMVEVRIPPTTIPATTFTIVDRWMPGLGPKTLPEVEHPGELVELGYHTSKPEKKRRDALKKAVHRYGKKSVEGMLALQEGYRSNEKGPAYETFKMDRDWVSRHL